MHRRTGILTILFIGFLGISFTSFYSGNYKQDVTSGRERKVQKIILSQIISFRDYVKDSLYFQVTQKEIEEKKLNQSFIKSRLLFKKFEWAAEYFAGDLTKRLNGPPVQEIENADLLDPAMAYTINPMGLQVIEELAFPHYDSSQREKLISEVKYLVSNTEYLISYFNDHQPEDWRILDAAKLEIFRIITLGISGFDNPLSLNSMNESAMSLESLRKILAFYTDTRKEKSLLKEIDAAINYLRSNSEFDTFNRAVFITDFANKISATISALEQNLPGRKIKYNRMLNQEAKTLFDSGVFNVNAFDPGPEFNMTDDKTKLGQKLFFDVSLSGTKTRSCGSCHKPELGFADGKARNSFIHDTAKLLSRNTPTLINAALQSNYFYDMRALTLEDQARDVINNKQEMDGSMDAIIKYISDDSSYRKLFSKAFPESTESGITSNEITNAIASYVRSLTKLNSRFDEYMRGERNALSGQEIKGFNLFMGKARCATCHFVPLFNGITPPKYIMSDAEVLGVPSSLADSTLDPDLGYYGIIGVDSYKHAFKTPTVRNIDKTAPYMHNGVYSTLIQVMDFYNNGGGAGLGIKLPNQTLSEKKLQLTEEEENDIIAFMKSLDSK